MEMLKNWFPSHRITDLTELIEKPNKLKKALVQHQRRNRKSHIVYVEFPEIKNHDMLRSSYLLCSKHTFDFYNLRFALVTGSTMVSVVPLVTTDKRCISEFILHQHRLKEIECGICCTECAEWSNCDQCGKHVCSSCIANIEDGICPYCRSGSFMIGE